jgi:arylsulfatase A-like enzyme
MKALARVLVVLGSLAAWGCRDRSSPPSPTPRPSPSAGMPRNVLLLTIDTLRADHLGIYGYRRNTSPRMDAFARSGVVFDQAYTYWPKTRASMIMMFTGRRPSQNGYSKTHPVLLEFNQTIASTLKQAGYRTAALVDNANVAAQYGYAKGFDSYRETWQEVASLKSEMDRTRAISEGALEFLRGASKDRPFLLWLHYVNPHAPYTPPPPYDTAFLDDTLAGSARLRVVKGYKGGVHENLAVPGQDRLGYYVAQYDGEIAAVDQEVGRVIDALGATGHAANTIVILTSDHGESLGEHDYYFDHGEDLFEPSLRIPLVIVAPGGKPGSRSNAFASTLDVFPTILDAVKLSYPPDLAGHSLYPAVMGQPPPPRERLFAQNDMNLRATFDGGFKLVSVPVRENEQLLLFDRRADPGETRNVRRQRPDDFRIQRRELDLYFERMEKEWVHIRRLLEGAPGEGRMTPEACEQLKALGYVQQCGK